MPHDPLLSDVQSGRLTPELARLVSGVLAQPELAQGWLDLGRAIYARSIQTSSQDDSALAERALRRAVDLADDLSDAHLFLALCLGRARRYEEARLSFRRAVDTAVYRALPLAVFGDFLADQGDFPAADRALRAALRHDPQCALAWIDLGRTLVRDARTDRESNLAEALECFRAGLAAATRSERVHLSAEAHYRIADALVASGGRRGSALHHLRSALALRPQHEAAGRLLGSLAPLR